jgi:plastocyanin
MRPRHQLVPVLLLAAALLAGCADNRGGRNDATSDPPATGIHTVIAKDLRFSPAAIQVAAGTKVTRAFQNGPVPHNVKGDGWDSGQPQQSGTFARTFQQPGTYDYACTLHPSMTGRVLVTAKP